jgi:hypothetical protein
LVDVLDALLYRPTTCPWVNNKPFTANGTFVGYIGDVYCMIAGANHDVEKHAAMMKHIDTALANCPLDVKLGSILHITQGPWWAGLSLGDKTGVLKRFAEVLKRGEATLKATMLGSANVLSSAVARAAARTVNVFVPPVTPLTVVDNAQDGFRFIARRLPSLAAHQDLWLAAYARAIANHAPDLAPSVMAKK